MGGADHGHGGEGAHADFRSKVWSMSGGPYCRPKHWRRNTAIAMAGIILICIPVAMKSAELEVFLHFSLFTFLFSVPRRMLDRKEKK
ncbi:uncharacterized protein LOC110825357 [Carica papaya]|uniref:uncharacterized protein LOC110825357 n=1 Tax=Carica papaya TaxID=3649 RepID=UPI000B8CA3DA|nr:uncharacterized protein LOC110825357 [Carica papaya]